MNAVNEMHIAQTTSFVNSCEYNFRLRFNALFVNSIPEKDKFIWQKVFYFDFFGVRALSSQMKQTENPFKYFIAQ